MGHIMAETLVEVTYTPLYTVKISPNLIIYQATNHFYHIFYYCSN